jgi:hypothetical protein
VIQKRFVRRSATTVTYLEDKAPNRALLSHRQWCAGVIDYTDDLTLLLGGPSSSVSVQGVPKMAGAGCPAHAARSASVRNANRLRPCWAQVACTLNMRSTKRLPTALCVP